MIKSEYKKSTENICNFRYLIEMTGGKKHLIKGILDVFLKQINEELICMNDAVNKIDYSAIKRYAHAMKSSVSVMGVSILTPVLLEMENLATVTDGSIPLATSIEKIKELNQKLNVICRQVIDEIEKDILDYV